MNDLNLEDVQRLHAGEAVEFVGPYRVREIPGDGGWCAFDGAGAQVAGPFAVKAHLYRRLALMSLDESPEDPEPGDEAAWRDIVEALGVVTKGDKR